jgi:TIR domain
LFPQSIKIEGKIQDMEVIFALFLFLSVCAILKSLTKDRNRGGTWIAMSSRPMSIAVFCASVPEDEAWLHRLETHLNVLQQQGLLSLWHNQLISPGTSWQQEIDTHLETASIILLLVSADFLASEGMVMTRALERHAANKARVIPLLVRPSGWQVTPLAQLRVLPTNGKPLAVWQHGEQEQALADVASALRRVIVAEYGHQTVPVALPLPPQRAVRASSQLFPAIVGGSIFVSGSAVAWFLIQMSKIPQPWAGILIAVCVLLFGILVLMTFRRAFFSDPLKRSAPSDSNSTSSFPLSPPVQISSFAAGREIRLEIIEAPMRIEKAVSYKNVFLFNERLLDPKEFFGRKNDRITLLDRSSRGASTSIVGPRRIGKT